MYLCAMDLFKNLGLNDDLIKGIESMGFQTPTPVQELVIPTALTTTGDIVALAHRPDQAQRRVGRHI